MRLCPHLKARDAGEVVRLQIGLGLGLGLGLEVGSAHRVQDEAYRDRVVQQQHRRRLVLSATESATLARADVGTATSHGEPNGPGTPLEIRERLQEAWAGKPLPRRRFQQLRRLDDRRLRDHPQRVERHVREEESGERQMRALSPQRGEGKAREQGKQHQVGVVVLSPCRRLSEGGEPAYALALR